MYFILTSCLFFHIFSMLIILWGFTRIDLKKPLKFHKIEKSRFPSSYESAFWTNLCHSRETQLRLRIRLRIRLPACHLHDRTTRALASQPTTSRTTRHLRPPATRPSSLNPALIRESDPPCPSPITSRPPYSQIKHRTEPTTPISNGLFFWMYCVSLEKVFFTILTSRTWNSKVYTVENEFRLA